MVFYHDYIKNWSVMTPHGRRQLAVLDTCFTAALRGGVFCRSGNGGNVRQPHPAQATAQTRGASGKRLTRGAQYGILS